MPILRNLPTTPIFSSQACPGIITHTLAVDLKYDSGHYEYLNLKHYFVRFNRIGFLKHL